MGLTSINPLGINGKNGPGTAIGPAPLPFQSFLLFAKKAKRRVLCKPEPGEASLHGIYAPASSEPFWQMMIKTEAFILFPFLVCISPDENRS